MKRVNNSIARPLAVLMVLVISGCAVQQGSGGTVQFGLDNAALLGTALGTFRLQDGSSATLRLLSMSPREPQYSIKLEKYLKVIPLGTAQRMRLDDAQQIGDRTVAVITRYENSCVRTQLLSFKGSEVLTWTVNHQDCRSEPSLRVEGDRLYLSYAQNRFVYRDARLAQETLPATPPSPTASTWRPQPAPAPRLPTPHAAPSPVTAAVSQVADPSLPPPPPKLGADAMVVSSEPKKIAGAKDEPSKQTAKATPRANPAQTMPPSKPLEFQQQEQQPVRIILD